MKTRSCLPIMKSGYIYVCHQLDTRENGIHTSGFSLGPPFQSLIPLMPLMLSSLLLFSCKVMSESGDSMDCSSPGFLCLWDFPGKNAGVGCHFLHQGIFLTQGSNPCLLHGQADSEQLSHQGSLLVPSSLRLYPVGVGFQHCTIHHVKTLILFKSFRYLGMALLLNKLGKLLLYESFLCRDLFGLSSYGRQWHNPFFQNLLWTQGLRPNRDYILTAVLKRQNLGST